MVIILLGDSDNPKQLKEQKYFQWFKMCPSNKLFFLSNKSNFSIRDSIPICDCII